jgi:hypothetical protein
MMKIITRLLAMSVFVFASAIAAAQAPAHIDTAAFSIANPWSQGADVLLSNTNGVARIGLSSAAGSLSAFTSRYQEGNFYAGLFEVTVNPGYRVTGFSFSGTFEGTLEVAPNPDGSAGNGFAFNSGNIEFSAGSRPYGIFYGEHTQRVDMLDGVLPFVMSSGQLSLTTDFNLSLQGLILVSAYPSGAPQVPPGIDSYASLRLANPVFTIYTAVVPEPETYAMLLAGIAVIGLIGRGRQRA